MRYPTSLAPLKIKSSVTFCLLLIAEFAPACEVQKLTALDDPTQPLGWKVATSGNLAVVGSNLDACEAGAGCGAAYVYRLRGSSWVQEQKLTASDASAGHAFGVSVSVSSEVVMVGANGAACASGEGCGAAYVYRFNGAEWVEEQKLVASDPRALDRFGESVSLDGDVALVGAPLADCPNAPNCGASYVYRFNGLSWIQEGKLTAPVHSRSFGSSVSVSGPVAVIGVPADNCAAGASCGAAYVFRFDGSTWLTGPKLTVAEAAANDSLGTSVSVNGETVVVGAPLRDCTAGVDCGAAYVYQLDGLQATRIQELMATDTRPSSSRFGASLSVSGLWLIVGARDHDCHSGAPCGVAYAYRFDGAHWVQRQKLTASDHDFHRNFGIAVSVHANVAIIGASGNFCTAGSNCGTAFMYRLGSTWMEQQELGDHTGRSALGSSVSIHDDVAVIGDSRDHCHGGFGCGSAYVYRFDGISWSQEQKLTASDGAPGAQFGVAVGVGTNGIVIGASRADCAAGERCGAAYVYQFDGSTWVETQKLFADDEAAYAQFGLSVSTDEDLMLVGFYGQDCNGGYICGAAYVYRFDGSTWIEEQKLAVADSASAMFGFSVAISGDSAIVGAGLDDCAAGAYCGSAYLFRFNGSTWVEEQKLTAFSAANEDEFGWSVAISGNTAIVGAYGDDCPTQANCGAVYVYRFNGSSWFEDQKIRVPDAVGLGYSVTVSDDAILAGTNRRNCLPGTPCQEGYVFRLKGSTWFEEQKLTASDGTANDRFGLAVALSGDRAVVGAPGAGCTGWGYCGAAYLYAIGPDCDANGQADFCDVRDCTAGDSYCQDCNGNRVPDPCDIAEFESTDVNSNGVPDECEPGLVAPCALQKLNTSDRTAYQEFGTAVSWSRDVALVGAPSDDCTGGQQCGAAYVYRFDGPTMMDGQRLPISDIAADDRVGGAVALDGNVAVIAATGDDCAAGESCGTVHVFRYNGLTWMPEQKLVASDPSAQDFLGSEVAVQGDLVVAGAVGQDCIKGGSCGSAYVFRFNGSTWVEEQKLAPSDSSAGALFGNSASISENRIVIGAPGLNCTAGIDCGAAYVYRFNGVAWIEEQKLTSLNEASFQGFARAVSISGDMILVGVPGRDCEAGIGCGAAILYRFDGVRWNEGDTLTAFDASVLGEFGSSLSLEEETAVIGAGRGGCTPQSRCGAAYVYRLNGSWFLDQKLTAIDEGSDDEFGESVSLSDGVVLVGASGARSPIAFNGGAAYVFAVAPDCNGNGEADLCDVRGGLVAACQDCNQTGVLDQFETLSDGDFDANGVLTLSDFTALSDCLGGPDANASPSLPGCDGTCLASFDGQQDHDVDLADLAEFQRHFSEK